MMDYQQLFYSIIEEDLIPPISEYRNRQIEIPDQIPGKAVALIGVRRSGKSSFLRQIRKKFLDDRFQKNQISYIGFDDERLFDLKASDLGALLTAVDRRAQGMTPTVIFLDEIHRISGWESFVSRVLRETGRIVYLTGSSARMLSKEVATAMRGRSLAYDIFPLSFTEFTRFHEHPITLNVDSFRKYLMEGGFPETVGKSAALRNKILQEYAEVLLLRDVVERNKVSNIPAIRHLFFLLLNQTSGSYTVNKLFEKLRATGIRCEKALVSDAIRWFEDCYALFSVNCWSRSYSRKATNPKKIYAIDNGLANAVTPQSSEEGSHQLENAVYLFFRRQGIPMHYYRSRKTKREVDFVLPGPKLVQVCVSLAQGDVRDREIAALTEAMRELRVREGMVITINEKEEIPTPSGTISVLPAWEFLR